MLNAAIRPGPPVISVVVFVLNSASTIRKALESVTAADQPPVELLVLDGGSSDGTLDIIREFAPKIAYWRSHHDGSAVVALNEGVARATGDIICLLPADDWLEPGALHVVREAFREDPALEVLTCGTRVVHLDDHGDLVVDAKFNDPRVLDFTMANIVRFPLTTGRFLLRRLYNSVGALDPRLGISNDLDFLIRVLVTRPRSKVIAQLVLNYRRHAGSRTLGGNQAMMLQLRRDFVQLAERHLPDTRLSVRERRALLDLHGRSSARLAWLLLRVGHIKDASAVLARAMRRNWLFPAMIPVWIATMLARRAQLSA
jgi:glycosyltransferase involved in cell wall biosynthesis